MKVEITDRAAWLERVEAKIARIEAERARRDAEYVALWRRSIEGRLTLLFNRDAQTPTHLGWFTIYPSNYAWGDLAVLRGMRRALRSENTGTIYFDEEELAVGGA
jgi:hypothetical protein